MGNKYGRLFVDVMAMHEGVTGSCIPCVVKLPKKGKSIKFIVDCGMFQEEKYSKLNKELLFNASEVDFVVVTHAHVDHIGRLPMLSKNYYSGNIFCSEQTAELLPYSLKDCSKVMNENSKRRHEKPLYTEFDVERTLEKITPVKYRETVNVHENVKITFFENGHLYGASLILIQIEYPGEGKINFLFTGDYSSSNCFFEVPELQLQQYIQEEPVNVVIEATYGSMTTSEMEPCFEKNIIKALNEKKDIIIPAFSLGRSQEILLFLTQLQKAKKLDPKIIICYDGKLGTRYTKEIFLKNKSFFEETQNFLPENLIFIDKGNREEISIKDSRQKIIVGSSGMGSYGPMQTLIPYYIQKNALIHFTGYCAEGTLGRRLMDAETNKKVTISGMVVKKRADVKFTKEFTAHAKSNELIRLLQKIENIHTVIINHGSEESKDIFSEKALEEVPAKNVVILNRNIGFRISRFGLEKPFNTKFI